MRNLMMWCVVGMMAMSSTALLAVKPDHAVKEGKASKAGETAASKAVDEAITRRFAGATYKIDQERTINAVKVYDVTITDTHGNATAVITDDGEFLITGIPGSTAVRNLPAPVQAVTSQVFASQPEQVTYFERTTFLVDTQVEKHTYRMEFNALGQLTDIQSAAEMRWDDPSKLEKASKSETDQLLPKLKEYLGDPKIQEAYHYPDAADFFLVTCSTSHDRSVQIVLNTRGDVDWWRVVMAQADLPKPVGTALSTMFKSAKILRIVRNQVDLYNCEQKTASGDTLSLHVSPTGDVTRIRNAEADAVERSVSGKHRATKG
jgi:hypothetical protein